MHELSVAMSLLDVIAESLIRDAPADARATRVTVEVGALSGVVPAALRTAFRSAIARTELAGCAIEVVEVDVTIRCQQCGAETRATSANDLRCAVCRTPSAQVVRGRELDVVAIEITAGPLAPVPGGEGAGACDFARGERERNACRSRASSTSARAS